MSYILSYVHDRQPGARHVKHAHNSQQAVTFTQNVLGGIPLRRAWLYRLGAKLRQRRKKSAQRSMVYRSRVESSRVESSRVETRRVESSRGESSRGESVRQSPAQYATHKDRQAPCGTFQHAALSPPSGQGVNVWSDSCQSPIDPSRQSERRLGRCRTGKRSRRENNKIRQSPARRLRGSEERGDCLGSDHLPAHSHQRTCSRDAGAPAGGEGTPTQGRLQARLATRRHLIRSRSTMMHASLA